MLNIEFDENVNPHLREMVMELRRAHVSRFPVVVQNTENRRMVRFLDSRFLGREAWNHRNALAIVSVGDTDDKGRNIYQIKSRLIQNEKFACHNDSYYTKETTDKKKMIKWLKEYAKPYTSQEIVDRTPSNIASDFEEWQDTPWREARSMVTFKAVEILEEIVYLRSLGVQFRSDNFRKAAEEGLEAYNEAKRRKSIKTARMHAFIQPDGSLMVTCTPGAGLEKAGSWTYERVETAPACVQQQIAMLRICESNTYIPEVGKKMDDHTFWIHVNPDEFNSSNA